MVQFRLATPLGIPVNDRDFHQTHHALERAGRLREVTPAMARQAIDAMFRDGTLQYASGRWRSGHPDPQEFVPGDIPAIRAMAADAIVRAVGAVSVQQATRLHLQADAAGRLNVTSNRQALLVHIDPDRLLEFPVTALQLVELYQAVPYFIPTTAAAAVLGSRPPQAALQHELRLPFERILVLFGADLELDPASYPWPPGFPEHVPDRFQLINDLVRRGGHLSGVILLADRQGRLREDVLWIVAANPDPSAPWPVSLDRVRGLVRGWRHAATLGPLVTNLAAAVAWALWREPPPLPELPANPTDRQLRKALKRNAVRVRERRGALAGVRVLDLARNAARARTRPADPDAPRVPRASPVPHLRAGHFRNVRVGPRDAYHLEPRWIPPTWVRGSLDGGDQRLVVRRLPPPAVWTRRELRPRPSAGDSPVPPGPVDAEVPSPGDPAPRTIADPGPFEPGFP
jgi:hypothetical protein